MVAIAIVASTTVIGVANSNASEPDSSSNSVAAVSTSKPGGDTSVKPPCTDCSTPPVTETPKTPITETPATTPTPPTTDVPEVPEVPVGVPSPPVTRTPIAGAGTPTGQLPFTGPGDVILAIVLALLAGTGGILFLAGASGREQLDALDRRTMDSPTGFRRAYGALLKEQVDE